MPERLECEVLQKARYINTLTFTFTFTLAIRILISDHFWLKFWCGWRFALFEDSLV